MLRLPMHQQKLLLSFTAQWSAAIAGTDSAAGVTLTVATGTGRTLTYSYQ
jgi:hypothetical protein